MPQLYGIHNCDTVKKAKRWLEEHNINYRFHDFRKDGLQPQQVRTWLQQIGWEALLNKRSATWRQLPEVNKAQVNETTIVDLLCAHPTLIKRPVLSTGEHVIIGFNADDYGHLLI